MKYGLIGERLGHSFSKTIHEKLGYDYELLEIARDELDLFMRERDFLGINVTIPYKQEVIPYLDVIDEAAREIGAVNTIVNRGGKLYGYNTDFYGMRELFFHARIDAKDKKAAILGSGGTSKTAVAVLKSLGAREVLRVSRSGKDGAITYEELTKNHSDTEIIINTTPAGMFPDIFGYPIDISDFKMLKGVVDAVYNPINTTLVQKARENGIAAESGLYMLVGQAVRASEIFLDKAYPDETLERIFEGIKAQKENIVLIGMPASGKTTVGKIIADKLGRKFIDTDDIITERIGMSIKDFFAKEGEAAFRNIESEVIGELACENSLVIATGGGAVLRRENVSALKYNGKIIFLDRSVEKLIPTESRPLSSDRESIKKRYDERYGIYCSACDLHIDGDGEAYDIANTITENYL